jgi:hypothetical protein
MKTDVLPDVDLSLTADDKPACVLEECGKEALWRPVFSEPECDCHFRGVCDEHRILSDHQQRERLDYSPYWIGWSCWDCGGPLGYIARWERV